MSDKFFGLIMYLIMLPVIVIMAAMLSNETKPKKNIILGVTLPYSARLDGEVLSVCAAFRRKLWGITGAMAALGVPLLFIPYFSVQLTAFLLWILLEIALPFIAYAKANLRLKALKKKRGWFIRREDAAETVVDMSVAAAPQKRLSAWWFAPPVVISLLPAALALTAYKAEEATAFIILSLAITATVLLSVVLYPLIFRLRTDVAGPDSGVNAALTNVRRAAWGRAWIYIAWTTALLGFLAWVFRSSEIGQLVTILLYSFALMWLCCRTELGLRGAQEKLTAQANAEYIDEDEYWPLGIFYNNPNDRHLSVNDRVGMNMTINLAKPMGKFLMGLTALILLCMPLTGVWVMGVEFTPRRVEPGEESVRLTHLTEKMNVDYDKIDSLELIETLPDTRRVSGTGMGTLREGKFTVEGYGMCAICLDPTQAPFIVLKSEGRTYIFNAETPSDTRAVFADIRSETDA